MPQHRLRTVGEVTVRPHPRREAVTQKLPGRSPGFRVIESSLISTRRLNHAFPSMFLTVALLWINFPVTVALPRRVLTAFPFILNVSLTF